MGWLVAQAGQDWMPLVAVILGAALALLGALASIIFWDLRRDVKKAVDTLTALLRRQEDHDDRITWLEGFHPTRHQLAQRYGDRSNGGR